MANAPATAQPASKPAAKVQSTGNVAVVHPPMAPRAAAPIFTIQTIEDSPDWQNMLVYGDYGAGKTHLAASANDVPEMNDVLMISAEGGEKTVKKWPGVDVIRINQYSQMARIYEFLRLHCVARDRMDEATLRKLERNFRVVPPIPKKQLRTYSIINDAVGNPDMHATYEPAWKDYWETHNAKQYNTVIIDSLSELHKYCMYQLLGITIGTYKLDMEPDSPQFQEWGRASEMIRLLVRTFRDLPIHKIMTAARDLDKDETQKYHYAPMLPGKLSREIQGFFDTVGLLMAAPNDNTGAIERRLYLVPGKSWQAKNRYKNFVGTYLDNPTMADLYKLET